jgi:hypothetical protein
VLLAVGIVCAMIAAMALAVLLADRRRERRRREQRYRDLDMKLAARRKRPNQMTNNAAP